jgi:hypothetical protein
MDPIEIYDRCLSGKPYSLELKIYSENYLKKVIKELEEIEEYEKCRNLLNFINLRFDHKYNYTL